jgi:hypothetical protein
MSGQLCTPTSSNPNLILQHKRHWQGAYESLGFIAAKQYKQWTAVQGQYNVHR